MIFRLSRNPSVTAGLMWQPDTWPIVYAIASSTRPNANATPKMPMTSEAMIARAGPDEEEHRGSDELGADDAQVGDAG